MENTIFDGNLNEKGDREQYIIGQKYTVEYVLHDIRQQVLKRDNQIKSLQIMVKEGLISIIGDPEKTNSLKIFIPIISKRIYDDLNALSHNKIVQI